MAITVRHSRTAATPSAADTPLMLNGSNRLKPVVAVLGSVEFGEQLLQLGVMLLEMAILVAFGVGDEVASLEEGAERNNYYDYCIIMHNTIISYHCNIAINNYYRNTLCLAIAVTQVNQ